MIDGSTGNSKHKNTLPACHCFPLCLRAYPYPVYDPIHSQPKMTFCHCPFLCMIKHKVSQYHLLMRRGEGVTRQTGINEWSLEQIESGSIFSVIKTHIWDTHKLHSFRALSLDSRCAPSRSFKMPDFPVGPFPFFSFLRLLSFSLFFF
jgi:hypothetical protein